MRISVKIIAILILLTVVIACNKQSTPTATISTTPTTYTVTFSSEFMNIGSNTTMPNPTYETVTTPATTVGSLPSNPKMQDSNGNDVYTFGGWWTATGGNGIQFTTSTTVTSDLIVYAYWYKYQVTFISDGTTVYATRGTIPPATTVDKLPTSPTKTGYTFGGWYTTVDGGGTQFFNSTSVTKDITVYAYWIPSTKTVYTVTYDGNGGTSVGAQYVTSAGATVGTLPPNPTYLFHTFNSWNTLAGGAGTVFDQTTPVTKDITVYAQWIATPGYTITFNSGWGTAVDAQYVIPIPPATATTVDTSAWPTPTKHCYTFNGWWTEPAGNVDATQYAGSIQVTADITVYANWSWVGNTTTPTTYAIGDFGPSCVGKVFYITDGGKQGYEAAPPGWYDPYSTDADPSFVWISGNPDNSGNQQTQTTLNGNTSTAIGKGLDNSNAIIKQSTNPDTPSSNSAAQYCENYRGGGLKDWYLPSKDELAQLYAQKDVTRWGGFIEDYYWSSSEYDTWDAWSQSFADGTQAGTLKSYDLYIRPIRHFDYSGN
ncbi:MAG: InlB B-repeat-containing protein [Smithella sp.]